MTTPTTMALIDVAGLRPVAPDSHHFDPDRTGLDHNSFTNSRAQLDAVSLALDVSIDRGDVTEFNGRAVLAFFDSDGISLELSLGREGQTPR